MRCRDLRDFLVRIDSSGGVHHIAAAVDPDLEMAAIIDRVSKSAGGGPALVFDNVKGSRFRVVANLFGSEQRMAAALGCESLDDLYDRFAELLSGGGSGTALSSLARLPAIGSTPVQSDEAPCREVVHSTPNLGLIPVPHCWPGDGKPNHSGRFMTLPLVMTRGAEGGQNCGMYRVALLGADRVAIHWNPGSGGAHHAAAWHAVGTEMPVAIALGGPPALIFAAALPLPATVDEFGFAGLLLGEPVQVVKCLTSDLVVPAGAELVIEGFITPGETASDGAFGNHTGYYQPPGLSPLVRVSAVTHRADMIYPTTLVGPPPMEDCWLAAAAGRLLLALLQIDFPGVVAIYQPLAGIFHGGTIISIKEASGNGLDLIDLICEVSWLKESRLLLLVDAEQDPADIPGVYWRVLNNVTWERDLRITGTLLALDATAKPDGRNGGLEQLSMDQHVLEMVNLKWREYGFNDE
jgi:4-hydroxy-3-polyprenylbenzoate decarboxylase